MSRTSAQSFFPLAQSHPNHPVILHQLDLANVLTLVGAMFGFAAILCAIEHQLLTSLLCLIFAGIADSFDGVIARQSHRTDLQSEVGKHLDTLADACSFGISPIIFAYCFGLRSPVEVVILLLYLSCCLLRLAYFNSIGLQSQQGNSYFIGLPATSAALFIPLVFLSSFVLPLVETKFVLLGLYLVLAILMVSNIPVKKLQGLWYVFALLGAIALTGVYTWALVALP